MTQKAVARIGLGKVIFGIIIVVLSLFASALFSKQADLNDILDGFSLSVRNYDRDGANKGLEALKKSYVSFSDFGLQYFADRFWFKDMYLYEAAAVIVNEDFEKAIELLKSGHEDDYRAFSMRGVAKFRVLHAAYHSEAARKDKKIKDDILRMVLENVRPDFEAAVKKGPGPAYDHDSAYNYDLASDPKLARKTLESVRPGLRFILGIQVEGQGPSKRPGRVKPGEKRVDDPSPGSGDTRKKG